ncbi:hypothetical protein [Paracoccus fontiphilus]|uniref:Uncharacterized protein n=1 Tax=Paracoccus fontiphilus TaxID=1815556 RepID=A0ABV7IAS0_9RHOB|nr:hypothetical protein [Paracoccus fontiphilus]
MLLREKSPVSPDGKHTSVERSTDAWHEPERRILGRTRLTGGNIRNSHINLSKLLNMFPEDAIGGKNKTEAAPRQIRVEWGGPQHVITDIDGSKFIFRSRGWVRRFFEASQAKEGDIVVVTETAPYHINVSIEHVGSNIQVSDHLTEDHGRSA